MAERDDENLNQPWGWIWTYVSWLVPTRFLPWLHAKATGVLSEGEETTLNADCDCGICDQCMWAREDEEAARPFTESEGRPDV